MSPAALNGPILSLDTSTKRATVALYYDGVLAEHNWQTQNDHTKELLPIVQQLLTQQNITLHDLAGLAVAIGPGSFNGIRVGVSTAKALALALNIPIIGIGTLEASAYQYQGLPFAIRSLLNAGRGQINTALYKGHHSDWQELQSPEALSLQELIERITEPVIICGEIEPGWAAEIQHHRGDLAFFPPIAGRLRRAAYLADLAWHRLLAGAADDLASLQPLYLRNPAITRSKRQLGFNNKEECR